MTGTTYASTATEAAPLVDAEWLHARLGDPRLRLLDIRSVIDKGGRDAYERAHIPGAVYTDYTKEGWRATRGMATGLLPEVDALAALFSRLGLAPDQHVVIVGAGNGPGDFSAAARVYWTFKMVRHRALSILDGGMAAWTSDPQRPVESGAGATPQPTRYPISFDPTWRCDLALAMKAVADKTAVLLDSRATAFFEGRDKSPQAKRAGRLPGAVQVDHVSAFDSAKGRLKSLPELEALFRAIPDGPVVNYCNTGQQAATTWFALSEILGRRGVTLYDGSMSEWTEEAERPVAVG
jgi:thiosulfate/3-mercaptopyruvate sulfurtransferase